MQRTDIITINMLNYACNQWAHSMATVNTLCEAIYLIWGKSRSRTNIKEKNEHLSLILLVRQYPFVCIKQAFVFSICYRSVFFFYKNIQTSFLPPEWRIHFWKHVSDIDQHIAPRASQRSVEGGVVWTSDKPMDTLAGWQKGNRRCQWWQPAVTSRLTVTSLERGRGGGGRAGGGGTGNHSCTILGEEPLIWCHVLSLSWSPYASQSLSVNNSINTSALLSWDRKSVV